MALESGVGYATLIWVVSRPLSEFGVNAFAPKEAGHTGAKLAVGGVIGAGVLSTLVFFTFHFGMFHFVHSVFLNHFFPIVKWNDGFPFSEHYLEVVKRYGIFLPAAFLAERAAFAPKPEAEKGKGGGHRPPQSAQCPGRIKRRPVCALQECDPHTPVDFLLRRRVGGGPR
ncbi:MAG: hypothetical protein RIS54_201 [Verrucomicrobiota bacterium]